MAARKKASAGIGVVRVQTEQEKSQYIASLVSQWEKQAEAEGKVEGKYPFITISREVGCRGFEVGMALAEHLNREFPSETLWMVYDREIVQKIADNLHMSKRLVELLTERSYERISDYLDSYFKGRPTIDTVFKESVKVMHGLCEKGHSIVIGQAGCVICSASPKGFHLRLTAPFAWRVEQYAEAHKLSPKEAERRVRLLESEREERIEKFYGRNISDPDLYDMILNEAKIPPELLSNLVLEALKGKGLLK